MPQLIRKRALAADDWVRAGGDAAAGAARLILPLADYVKARAAGEPGADRAVQLQPEEQDLSPLEPWLASLPLVAVHFGSTGDGRGYTQARMLRDRYGFTGELRAVGQVRLDQMFFLARCGFDAFELLDGENPAAAIAELERFSVAYQASVDGLTQPRRRYGS